MHCKGKHYPKTLSIALPRNQNLKTICKSNLLDGTRTKEKVIGMSGSGNLLTFPEVETYWHVRKRKLIEMSGSGNLLTCPDVGTYWHVRKWKLKTISSGVWPCIKTPKTAILTVIRKEKPTPVGYKFIFTHFSTARLCFVLTWLDVRENRLRV